MILVGTEECEMAKTSHIEFGVKRFNQESAKILAASEDELDQMIRASGEDPDEVVKRTRAAIKKALSKNSKTDNNGQK